MKGLSLLKPPFAKGLIIKVFKTGFLVFTWDGSRERKGHVIAAVLAENVKVKGKAI